MGDKLATLPEYLRTEAELHGSVIPERVQVVKRFLPEFSFSFFPSTNVHSAPKLAASFFDVFIVAR